MPLLVRGGVTNVAAQARRNLWVFSNHVRRLAYVRREIVERLGQKFLLRGSLPAEGPGSVGFRHHFRPFGFGSTDQPFVFTSP